MTIISLKSTANISTPIPVRRRKNARKILSSKSFFCLSATLLLLYLSLWIFGLLEFSGKRSSLPKQPTPKLRPKPRLSPEKGIYSLYDFQHKPLPEAKLPRAPDVLCGAHRAPSCRDCPQGNGAAWCNGECVWNHEKQYCDDIPGTWDYVHPDYKHLTQIQAFQEVVNENDVRVNIILVKRPIIHEENVWALFKKYRKDILFMGISSFEMYPRSSPNPFSKNFSDDLFSSIFPGWLHMERNPEEVFPENVKRILLSESDFKLKAPLEQGYSYERRGQQKRKYDWVFSGTDQDVANNCVGWSSYAKNWSFALQAMEVMCSPEFNLKGVVVASRDKQNTTACTIPPECHGKVLQTTFIPQPELHNYILDSKFLFLPQVDDASPRVASQALSLNRPVLMNQNIAGGWKYMNDKTGEFFHDLSNFKQSLSTILEKERNGMYEPRQYVLDNWGDEKAGAAFLDFVKENFGDRVNIPEGTRMLLPGFA
uniref:Glycosyl transferase family 1 domain-containing protein n=1 Tax=Helicotheca tamesis TaxID=374047 RepID=A0A7S2IBL4_9STRA